MLSCDVVGVLAAGSQESRSISLCVTVLCIATHGHLGSPCFGPTLEEAEVTFSDVSLRKTSIFVALW